MAGCESHGLGYERVDDDPNAAALLDAMDATGRWAATQQLRAWERGHLCLAPGRRLLDVGCGLGDAALALAADLGSDGAVVGIDASAEMIAAATARAGSVAGEVRFEVGDALRLPVPDASFDAVRSERTLQWVPEPDAAVAEMARVVRPGGRVSLIDTDWSSLSLDVGDDRVAALVHDSLQVERARPSNIGRRLAAVAERAGLVVVAQSAATHRWDGWDADESPAPDGCFSMTSLAADLVESGRLDGADEGWFVSTIHAAARERRFAMALTMHAVVAARPGRSA